MRPAFEALFAIDDAMGDVVAHSSQPALAAIKLAWWRERLEELDEGKVPAEPRLYAVASELLPRGLSGRSLAVLEDGWLALLEEVSDSTRALDRGAKLFGLAAQLVGCEPSHALIAAGHLYAAGQVRRRQLGPSFPLVPPPNQRMPLNVRRITALAVLAKRDLRAIEPEGTPARAWALLRHRLTGRI